MTPIEIMALILIIVSVVKILVILAKPSAWTEVIKKVWANPFLTGFISFILAVVVLYYLLQELTIVQIFASMLFLALLAAIGIATYCKEVVGIAQKLLKDKNILKKSWLYLIIWIVLIIWVIKELFM